MTAKRTAKPFTLKSALQTAADEFGDIDIEAVELVPASGLGVYLMTVNATGEASASDKAAICGTFKGQSIPELGHVLEVRPQVPVDAWAMALVDVRVPANRSALSHAASPFGGPVKLTGAQMGWLRRRGFDVPGMADDSFPHVAPIVGALG